MDGQSNISSQFLLYAAVFRLAIVAVGIASVVFGYRLLITATHRQKRDEGAINATVGGAHLSVQNLAPGTMFAAFGMMILAVMLYQGMPEMKQQRGDSSVVLRSETSGAETPDLSALTERGMNLERAGNSLAATEAYEEALDRVATPANNLALLYLQQNRDGEALGLARLAADLRPFGASILDTLADAYEATDNHVEALKAAARAAELDPKYRDKFEALRRKGAR